MVTNRGCSSIVEHPQTLKIMGRFDSFRINANLLPTSNAQELEDLSDLEFQTKDLEREFLDYHVGEDGYLYFEDFEYEMIPTDNPEGLFSLNLRKINQTIKKSYHSGDVIFYGKPWEHMYTFKASFQDGKLNRVDLLTKE
jgi:hypothetical protein